MHADYSVAGSMTFQWSVTEPRRHGTRLCGCSGLGRPVRFCRSVLLLRDVSLSRTERETDRQTDRDRDRETDRQRKRQTDRDRETDTERDKDGVT